MAPDRALQLIKAIHTVAWAFFASCIAAMPVFAWRRDFVPFLVLAGIVALEVGILALNGMRCPLTPLAARYTSDRRDNFDIYLPLLLARYNKQVFGTLYGLALMLGLARWLLG